MSEKHGQDATNSKRKAYIIPLNEKQEGVQPPWKPYYHMIKKSKFYFNTETKKSVWAERPHPKDSTSRKRPNGVDNQSSIPLPDYEEVMEIDEFVPTTPPSTSTFSSSGHFPMDHEEEPDLKRNKASGSSSDVGNAPPGTILPLVPWQSLVKPRRIIPYRACAILDTNVLIDQPRIVSLTIQKNILTVIPYAVVQELDALKKNYQIGLFANDACRSIQQLKVSNPYFVEVETTTEQRIDFDEYKCDGRVKDDLILKCAIRVKLELLSVGSALNFTDTMIVFVSNDLNLKLKAQAHDIAVHGKDEFLRLIDETQRLKELKEQQALLKRQEEIRKWEEAKCLKEQQKLLKKEKLAMEAEQRLLEKKKKEEEKALRKFENEQRELKQMEEKLKRKELNKEKEQEELRKKQDMLKLQQTVLENRLAQEQREKEELRRKVELLKRHSESIEMQQEKLKQVQQAEQTPDIEFIKMVVGTGKNNKSRKGGQEGSDAPAPASARRSCSPIETIRQKQEARYYNKPTRASESPVRYFGDYYGSNPVQRPNQQKSYIDESQISRKTPPPIVPVAHSSRSKLPLPHPSEEDPNWQGINRRQGYISKPEQQPSTYLEVGRMSRMKIQNQEKKSEWVSPVSSSSLFDIKAAKKKIRPKMPLPHPDDPPEEVYSYPTGKKWNEDMESMDCS